MLAPIDAPLGEIEERYRVVLTGAHRAIERECRTPALALAAAEIAALGSGLVTIQVQQIGDNAASRPALTKLTIGQE